MSLEGIGRLIPALYMLPGNEHLDLIGNWSLAQPQPKCEAGLFPGWGPGYYQQLNTDFYWLMARYMQGPYAADADILCDRYLERANGDCNLAVAYVGAYASQLNGTPEKFEHRLDERIDDQNVQGDKLVTWLIARAFAKGAVPGRLEPLAGYSDLESGMVAAESNASKFWVLQEMVARLASTNKTAQAKQLIEEHQSQFTSPEQQQAMASWSTKADALAAQYAEHATRQTKAAKDARIAELTRRRQVAIDRGDQAGANRFAQLLNAAQNANSQ